MACAACQRQRMAVTSNLKNGNVSGAARELVKGAAMLTGMLPKESYPTSHITGKTTSTNTPAVTQPSRNMSLSNAERLARNAAARAAKNT